MTDHNTIKHKTIRTGAEPAATALAEAEIGIKQVAAYAHGAAGAAASGKLYYGEDVDGNGTTIARAFGIGVKSGAGDTQMGVPIGGNLEIAAGTGISTTGSVSGDVTTVTIAATGGGGGGYEDGDTLKFADGSAGTPGLSLNSDANTGFYDTGTADELGFSAGGTGQIILDDGAIKPVTDNDIDLGTSGLEFKDLYIDGTAHIDTLDVDVNATVAGTLGVTGVLTADGGIDVDNFHLDGTSLNLSSGDMRFSTGGSGAGFNFYSSDAAAEFITITPPSASGIAGTAHGFSFGIRGTNSNGGGQIIMANNSGSEWTGFRANKSLSADYIYELPNSAPSVGEFLKVSSYSSPVAVLEWDSASGGSTSPAGSDTEIQFNNGGSFGGDSKFIWDDTALKISSATGAVTLLELKSTAATSSTGHGPFLDIRRDVTPSDGDELGRLRFLADSSSGGSKPYGAILCEAVDVTNSTVDGRLTFEATISNTNTEIFHAGAKDTSGNEAVFPATDNAIDLGTSSLQWANLYVDGIAYVDGINADGSSGLGTGSSPQQITYVSDVELMSPMMGLYEINVTGRVLTFICGVLTADDAA